MNAPSLLPALVEIQRLFDARGTLEYGEAVTQVEHALQCGTLEIQGGPMDEAEARAFEQSPCAGDAVRLRRWDDLGKQPGMATHSMAHFMAIAARWLGAGAVAHGAHP